MKMEDVKKISAPKGHGPKPYFGAERMDEMADRILEIILIQKRYRDKDYSASRLAAELFTNTRYVSQVVNMRFKCNYSAFVNKYRIEEAMRLLSDVRYFDRNMDDISYMVGFSSRQSFYNSFFKFAGMSPREYRAANLNLPALRRKKQREDKKARLKAEKESAKGKQ